MIENIRQEFIQILKESDWLDDESRNLALAKVFNQNFKNDFLLNYPFLNFYLTQRLITLILKLVIQSLFTIIHILMSYIKMYAKIDFCLVSLTIFIALNYLSSLK